MPKFIFLIFILLAVSLRNVAQSNQNESIQSLKKQLVIANNAHRADLLCKLALLYVYKPGEIAGDLDSALLLIDQAQIINSVSKDKATEANIYFIRSNALREKSDTASGHKAIDRSLNIYSTISVASGYGDAYIELSRYYNVTSKEGCLKKKECYEKALVQFQYAGLKEKQADALKELGDFNQLLRNYGLAMIDLRQALAIYTSIGYKNLQGIYDLLGIVSTDMGDFNNAIQYGLHAVETAESIPDTSMQLCTIYHRLAVAYGNWSKWDEAETYEKKALDVAIKYHDKDAIETILLNMCYMKNGRSNWETVLDQIKSADPYTRPWNLDDSTYMPVIYERTYLNGKDLKTASIYANDLIKILPRVANDQSAIHAIYPTLAIYFLATGKFETAKKYIMADLEYSNRNANKRAISVNYLLASKADSGMHHYKQALENYAVYKSMSDSMLNETKSFQLAQMQVAYETDKKDQDLKIKQQNLEVVTNKNKLQEVTINKADLTRNIIVIAALSLISILIVGYRIKQKHNSKLELQQKEINSQNSVLKKVLKEQQKLVEEKEWLVKEIHHRVKNNLQMIISLLNAQSEFLDHPSALNAIKESRERMQAVALIHQKLYQPLHGTFINMRDYIKEMVDHLGSSFANVQWIDFKLDIENVSLDVSQAVPLGLILNEAITNAIKYAFPAHQRGTVNILLRHTNTQEVLLKINDNGKGFPDNFDLSNNNSLGLQLIQLFSEQLEGDLEFKSIDGVEISLTFKQFYGKDKTPSLINTL